MGNSCWNNFVLHAVVHGCDSHQYIYKGSWLCYNIFFQKDNSMTPKRRSYMEAVSNSELNMNPMEVINTYKNNPWVHNWTHMGPITIMEIITNKDINLILGWGTCKQSDSPSFLYDRRQQQWDQFARGIYWTCLTSVDSIWFQQP